MGSQFHEELQRHNLPSYMVIHVANLISIIIGCFPVKVGLVVNCVSLSYPCMCKFKVGILSYAD